ncbi:MAG TPA: sigma-70 family RNA polymerase sigma factor [Segetibacter sp.]|jgi:RNA polymerase sigma factor (sigma-70 family)
MHIDTSTDKAFSPVQVKLIRSNDEKALKLFYQNNYPKVERYVLDNCGNIDEAKDVYQEAFIAVWRNIQLDRFQPQHEASLDGYLYQVAKNKWIDHLRKVKRIPLVALTNVENGIQEVELLKDEELLIKNIKINFKRLGQVCKDVLSRFYYQKQSMKEIAEVLNWTEATTRNNKYRCIQQLRKFLRDNTP